MFFVDASFEILDRFSVEFQGEVILRRHGVRRRTFLRFGQRRQERQFRLLDVFQRRVFAL